MARSPIVLLVDDEPRMLTALRRALRREGLSIETASNAEEAIDRIDAGPPIDLVISDHRMPGRTGAELLGEIRRRSPSTGRILLSGFTSEIGPSALAAADCAAVLSKPWDDAELKHEIRAALGLG